MKVILLNGKIGAGKSYIGSNLHYSLNNSAYIEGDSFLQINPFVPTEENYNLVAHSIANQVKTYAKFKTLDYVVISWVIWYEETFNILKKELEKFEFLPICLKCPLAELRKRVKEDIENKKRWPDNLKKTSRKIWSEGFTNINSNQSLEKILNDITNLINN